MNTLADLIAPFSEHEFLQLLRERRLTCVRGSGANRFATLGLDWSSLEPLLSGEHFPVGTFKIARGENQLLPIFYLNRGRIDVAKVNQVLARGARAIIRQVDRQIPALRALVDNIRRRTLERVTVAVIVTTGTDGVGAFKPHYDTVDVVTGQVEGSKRWQIHASPVMHPVEGMSADAHADEHLVFDDDVRSGDALFMPSGYWHRCESGPDRSIHAAFMFEPLSPQRVMAAFVSRMRADEQYRQPFLRMHDRDIAAAETALKALLARYLDQMSLPELIAWYHGAEDMPEM